MSALFKRFDIFVLLRFTVYDAVKCNYIIAKQKFRNVPFMIQIFILRVISGNSIKLLFRSYVKKELYGDTRNE